MNSASNDNRKKGGARCPICANAARPGYAPFCSKRCADVDLHRWLSGGYAIAGEEGDPDAVDELVSRSDEGA